MTSSSSRSASQGGTAAGARDLPAGHLPERGTLVGTVDLGGSHVSVALVDGVTGTVDGQSVRRLALDPHGPAAEILGTVAGAMAAIDSDEVGCWGLAVPGPFDYGRGVAQYEGVGKFDALHGTDLRAHLGARVAAGPGSLAFLNDADAFVLGEWSSGAVVGVERCVGLTLGSGIGSAFLDNGVVVDDGSSVPPQGSVHLLTWQGSPLEDTVSRRALRAAYGAVTAATGPDVSELAALARQGEPRAVEVFWDAFSALGTVLAPWVQRFGATHVVLGGSVSRSWDVVVPPFLEGMSAGGAAATVVPAARLDEAAFLGAALCALRSVDGVPSTVPADLPGALETA